jgi:hypothetical protein
VTAVGLNGHGLYGSSEGSLTWSATCACARRDSAGLTAAAPVPGLPFSDFHGADVPLASCYVGDLLRVPLSLDQKRLLHTIYDPFHGSGDWPVWQYVDQMMDVQFGLDAAVVLASLPMAGDSAGASSLCYGLTWPGDTRRYRHPDAEIALTVAGLTYVGEAEALADGFIAFIGLMTKAQRTLMPDPHRVVEAEVSSDAIDGIARTMGVGGAGRLTDPASQKVDLLRRKLRQLIGHEPFLGGIHQMDPQVERWTINVPAVLRAYHDVATVGDYVSLVADLVTPETAPSAPPSPEPLDVPYAAGYLDAVWRAETGSRLFVNADPASVARLTLPCESEEEFNSLISAMADVLSSVAAPGTTASPQRMALEAVRDWVVPRLDKAAADRVTAAFATLIELRHIRVAAQHSDARQKTVKAFTAIGLQFPPASWYEAWMHVVLMARGALDVIREEVHAGLLP